MAVAMVGALATQVYAEKTAKIKADVRSYFRQTSDKAGGGDAVSKMDMMTYTRLGASISNKGTAWTGSATVLHTFSYDGSTSNRDRYINLKNDTLAIRYGYFYWGDAAHGCDYCWQSPSWGAGGNAFGNRDDQLRISLPAQNVNFVLGMNADSATYDNGGTDASYTKNTMNIGVTWSDDVMEGLNLGVVYQSKSQSNANDTVGNAPDGDSNSEFGFGLTYTIDPKMRVSFNYDSWTMKSGDADALSNSAMDFIFDMDMDDVSGLSASYTMKTEAKSADVSNSYTGLGVNYKTNIADSDVEAWVSYYQTSDKDDSDGAEANSSSLLELLLRMAF